MFVLSSPFPPYASTDTVKKYQKRENNQVLNSQKPPKCCESETPKMTVGCLNTQFWTLLFCRNPSKLEKAEKGQQKDQRQGAYLLQVEIKRIQLAYFERIKLNKDINAFWEQLWERRKELNVSTAIPGYKDFRNKLGLKRRKTRVRREE